MAPEVYDQKYSFKSDIWSFGIIAYFVFTGGYLPFSGDTTPDIMNKVKNGKFKYLANTRRISKEAKSFIQSLLTVDQN
jgi:serine/threonine protein kinase